jgi:predicted PurR-regulated permease PerM
MSDPHATYKLEDRVFVGFVIAVTLAMAWILAPYYGAILWAVIAAILFGRVNRRIGRSMPGRTNTPALLTLFLVIGIVIVPAVAIGTLLIEEALNTYALIQSQQIDLGRMIDDVWRAVPPAAKDTLARMGFDDIASVQERFSSFLTSALRLAAGQAVNFGQGAFGFMVGLGIMLYLTYFLLRDGNDLVRKIGERMPMRPQTRRDLFDKFAKVIRATVKGSIVVAIVQGLIGGVVFSLLGIQAALLWGVVMGFLSLLPAVGTGIVWVPVAIYLFATGQITQGAILTFCGVFVIGMVDNVLRPILVGKDTRMPDWIVLLSTLGGISVMGINGFVVGPVIAALFIAAWDIFGRSRGVVTDPEPDEPVPEAS